MLELSSQKKSANANSPGNIQFNQINQKQSLKIAKIQLPEETDQNLFMEILRIKCKQKQARAKHIFQMQDQQLQIFFINYEFFQSLHINLKQEIQYLKTKLVKSPNRIYFGQVLDHKKHGKGISIYADSKIYEGEFLFNQKHGKGLQIYPNSNIYIGNYLKNKKHGIGTFYWFNMSTKHYKHEFIEYYKGSWWGGLPSGDGFHHRANGDYYQGQFRNGLKHGKGIQHFFNNDLYVGRYLNGLPEGYGEYYWSDGSNYKGQFKHGLRSGFGIWKKNDQKNCQYYKGYYALDKKCGYGVYNWQNGEYYKGEFFNDYRHGYGELYKNKNNLIYKGMWQLGKRLPKEKIPLIKQKQFQAWNKKFNSMQIKEFPQNDIKRIKQEGYSPWKNSLVSTEEYQTNFKNNLSIIISEKDRQKSQQKFRSLQKRRSSQKKQRSSEKKTDLFRSTSKKYVTAFNFTRLQSTQKKQRIGHRNCIPDYYKQWQTARSSKSKSLEKRR